MVDDGQETLNFWGENRLGVWLIVPSTSATVGVFGTLRILRWQLLNIEHGSLLALMESKLMWDTSSATNGIFEILVVKLMAFLRF